MHFLLIYHVTEDYLERRGEFRSVHIRHAREAYQRGELLLAGALLEPTDQAVLLFRIGDPGPVEDFARADPYVINGLVKSWEVRPWATVVGDSPAVALPQDL